MMIFCCGLNAPDFTEQSLSTLRCNGGRSPPSAINRSSILPLMALNSLYCADVPLSNYSLTHSLSSTQFTEATVATACPVHGLQYQQWPQPVQYTVYSSGHTVSSTQFTVATVATACPVHSLQ